MAHGTLQIIQIPAVSAIYFGLLQTGYTYYGVEKSPDLEEKLSGFQRMGSGLRFFEETRQATCQVYPYWPRASMLEAASFYVNPTKFVFRDFEKYREAVMSAGNISDEERSADLWEWIAGFPAALEEVLCSDSFKEYFAWETEWVKQQNALHAQALKAAQQCLETCNRLYRPAITQLEVILNPIKCAYSADYHISGNRLFVCAGMFKIEAVIHEFLHHAVHGLILSNRALILEQNPAALGLDSSYYLTEDAAGRLNAFEESFVRALTARVAANDLPPDLPAYLEEILGIHKLHD